MLEAMTDDADALLAQTVNEAFERARAAGRGDVADYLLLKESNDKIRQAALDWLFDSARAIAAQADEQSDSSIVVETKNPHQFAFGNSNLHGSLLSFNQGVRCLKLEAGWTRAPADGFMRGGALASARITHFGIARAGEDLLLVRAADNSINWFAIDKEEKRVLFDANNLRRHFQIFLGS